MKSNTRISRLIDPTDLVTVAKGAKLMGKNIRTFNRYAERGYIPFVEIDGHWVMRTDIDGDLAAVVVNGHLAVAARGHPAGG